MLYYFVFWSFIMVVVSLCTLDFPNKYKYDKIIVAHILLYYSSHVIFGVIAEKRGLRVINWSKSSKIIHWVV